jgi:hypothetical protein
MYASQFSQGLNNARLSKENTAYKAPTQPDLLLSSLFFSASDGCKIYQKYVFGPAGSKDTDNIRQNLISS